MDSLPLARRLVSGAVCALLVLGCDDTVSGPAEPLSGSLRAVVFVFGPNPDPDGYRVTVTTEAGIQPAPRTVPSAGGAVRFSNVNPGTYAVRLQSLAATCQVEGDNPLPATVQSDETTVIQFALLCPTSSATEIFRRVGQDLFAARFFLDGDGTGAPTDPCAACTFVLDFGSAGQASDDDFGVVLGSGGLSGTYSRAGATYVFDFLTAAGEFGVGPWLATGSLGGDCLAVDYNTDMELAGFVDAEYCRS